MPDAQFYWLYLGKALSYLCSLKSNGSRFSATEKPLRVRILIAHKGGRNGRGLHNLVEMTE